MLHHYKRINAQQDFALLYGPPRLRFSLSVSRTLEMTKRILVTGGAGFLGSHLRDRLMIAQGHDILEVDNCLTGSMVNIAHLFENPRFELIRRDVSLPLYVEVDEIPGLPDKPRSLLVGLSANYQDQRARGKQHAGAG